MPPPFHVLPHRSSCSHAAAARQPSSDLRWSRCGQAGAVPHGRAQLNRLRRLSQQTTPSKTVTQRGISHRTGRRGDTAQPSCSVPAARAPEFHQESPSVSIFTSLLRCIRAWGDNRSIRSLLRDHHSQTHANASLCGCDVFTFGQTGTLGEGSWSLPARPCASTHSLVVGYWKEAVERRRLSGWDGAEGRVSWTVETSRLVQGS